MFNIAITFIAAALLVPSAVVGQTTPTITPCVTNCTTVSLPVGGCTGLTDLACICTSNDFLMAVGACIAQDCPGDIDSATAAQNAECAAYGNSTSSTSDAGTGSSSSAAVVTPGGTTTRASVTPGATTRPPSTSSSHSTTSTSTNSTGAGFHSASIASGVTLALFGAAFSLF